MKYLVITALFLSQVVLGQANDPLKPELNKSIIKWTGKAAFSSYSQSGTLHFKDIELVQDQSILKSLKATVDMTSLYHENEDLKGHLKSADFFDVENYKVATFTTRTEIDLSKDSVGALNGTLKIKDVGKEVIMTYKVIAKPDALVMEVQSVIDRTEFNVTHNSPSLLGNLKDNAISDDVDFTAVIVLNRKSQ